MTRYALVRCSHTHGTAIDSVPAGLDWIGTANLTLPKRASYRLGESGHHKINEDRN
jgi:hypothetical protein